MILSGKGIESKYTGRLVDRYTGKKTSEIEWFRKFSIFNRLKITGMDNADVHPCWGHFPACRKEVICLFYWF
jgi:hypothetical protein